MKPPVAQAGQAQAQAQVHGHIISSRRGRGRGRRCTRCAHARAHAAFTNAHVHTHACPQNGRKCPLPVHGAGSARVCLRAHASCMCLQMHVRAHMRSPTHASTGARARTHAYPAHTHARMHAHPHRYLVVAAVVEVLVTDDALHTARNVSPRAAHAHEHACARAHTRTCVAYALDMLRTPTPACASALPLGDPHAPGRTLTRFRVQRCTRFRVQRCTRFRVQRCTAQGAAAGSRWGAGWRTWSCPSSSSEPSSSRGRLPVDDLAGEAVAGGACARGPGPSGPAPPPGAPTPAPASAPAPAALSAASPSLTARSSSATGSAVRSTTLLGPPAGACGSAGAGEPLAACSPPSIASKEFRAPKRPSGILSGTGTCSCMYFVHVPPLFFFRTPLRMVELCGGRRRASAAR